LKKITCPIVCPGSGANCVVHSEENLPVFQIYSTEMQFIRRFELPVQNSDVKVLSIAC